MVQEAYEWLGTPYVHAGDIKGKNGAVDCAMILISIFKKFGFIPEDFDPRPYSPSWHLHQNEARYMAGLEQFSKQIETPRPGDIAMYRFGRHASHGAMIVSEDLLIHAHKKNGQVALCERRSMARHLDSYWSVFV